MAMCDSSADSDVNGIGALLARALGLQGANLALLTELASGNPNIVIHNGKLIYASEFSLGNSNFINIGDGPATGTQQNEEDDELFNLQQESSNSEDDDRRAN